MNMYPFTTCPMDYDFPLFWEADIAPFDAAALHNSKLSGIAM